MNFRGVFGLIFTILLAAGCASTRPGQPQTQASAEPSEPRNVRIEIPKTDSADAQRAEEMVQNGMRQYERGLLDSAQRTLAKAVKVDPQNLKGWYYLHRVTDSIDKRDRENQYRLELLKKWRSIQNIT